MIDLLYKDLIHYIINFLNLNDIKNLVLTCKYFKFINIFKYGWCNCNNNEQFEKLQKLPFYKLIQTLNLKSYNHLLTKDVLPPTLKKLYLFSYTHPLTKDILPPNLQTLTLF